MQTLESYFVSMFGTVFCSKLASPNTSSMREPGTNPIHFDSDSPQDRKSKLNYQAALQKPTIYALESSKHPLNLVRLSL
jgi:hypothetical protein